METESLASDPLSPSSLWLSSCPGTFTTMVFCRRPGTALSRNKNSINVVRATQRTGRDQPESLPCSSLLPWSETNFARSGGPQSSHAAPSTKINSHLVPGNSPGLEETVSHFPRLKKCLHQEAKSQLSVHKT